MSNLSKEPSRLKGAQPTPFATGTSAGPWNTLAAEKAVIILACLCLPEIRYAPLAKRTLR